MEENDRLGSFATELSWQQVGSCPICSDSDPILQPREGGSYETRIYRQLIEQSGVYRGRPTWIANVNDPDAVIPAEVCELDGGDGETV